jgi:integrase
LECYFPDQIVRGKGSKTLAKDLEKQFGLDVRSGKYAAWKAAQNQPPPIAAPELSWTELVDFYVNEHILAKGLRWDWTFKYKIKVIRAAWADRPVGSIRVADVQMFINQFRKRGCAPATVRYYATLIGHMFKFAEKMDLIPQNPLKPGAIVLERVQNERTRRLLPEEEDRLWPVLEAMEDEPQSDPRPARRFLKGVVTMTLDTGLRRGSILQLQFKMVKWDQGRNGVLEIPAAILKQRRPQQVALTARARKVIDVRRKVYFAQGRYNGETFVFGKDNGTPYVGTCSFDEAWQEAKRRAGLKDVDLHFHDLRGEAASRLADLGVPVSAIQRFLGHRNLEMTQRYLRARVGEIDDTAAVLEQYQGNRLGATKGATLEDAAKSNILR